MKIRILLATLSLLLTFAWDASIGTAAETQVKEWKVIRLEESNEGHIITPKGLTVIKSRTYANNKKLTKVIVADGVTTMEAEAFAGCTNLTAVAIPKSVTKIGENVFEACPNVCVLVEKGIAQNVIDQLYLQELQYKVVGRDDTAIDESMIVYPKVGAIRNKNDIRYTVTQKTESRREVTVKAVELASKKSIKIPATITLAKKSYKVVGIEKNAFKRAKKVKTLTIGKNIKKIDNHAFKNCKKLKTVKILAKDCKLSGKSIWKGTSKKLVVKVPTSVLKKMQKRLEKSGLKDATVKAL